MSMSVNQSPSFWDDTKDFFSSLFHGVVNIVIGISEMLLGLLPLALWVGSLVLYFESLFDFGSSVKNRDAWGAVDNGINCYIYSNAADASGQILASTLPWQFDLLGDGFERICNPVSKPIF